MTNILSNEVMFVLSSFSFSLFSAPSKPTTVYVMKGPSIHNAYAKIYVQYSRDQLAVVQTIYQLPFFVLIGNGVHERVKKNCFLVTL